MDSIRTRSDSSIRPTNIQDPNRTSDRIVAERNRFGARRSFAKMRQKFEASTRCSTDSTPLKCVTQEARFRKIRSSRPKPEYRPRRVASMADSQVRDSSYFDLPSSDFEFFLTILPRLTPHRDNGVRHRSHSGLRRFEQLLRGAARDSVRVTCAQGVSPPPPPGPAFLRTSRRRHLPAQPQGNCSTHQKHVDDHAFRIHRPIAAKRARPPSPPSAHRKFFPATICPSPALESTNAMAPQPSNRPTKQIARRHHVSGRDVCPRRRVGNSAMPSAQGNGTSPGSDLRVAKAGLSAPWRKNPVSGPERRGPSAPGGR
jgi:hypothetical protein